MTRTPEQWRFLRATYLRQADRAEDSAIRFDYRAQLAAADEDVLVRDVYAEAAIRALREAEEWREAAARAETYALDAELPATVTVTRAREAS